MEVPRTVREPVGCTSCGETGYRGRIPIMEIVEVDEAAREVIRSGRIEELDAGQAPADTLFGHGLMLVAEGWTDLVEVERAVQL